MKPFSALLLLSALLPCSPARAADKAGAAQPVLMAAADAHVPVVRFTTARTPATSAGVAAALPNKPSVQRTSLNSMARATLPLVLKSEMTARALPEEAGVSTLDASPLRGAAHLVRAQRFNTSDGVSPDDFAICYRLSTRSSLQVIPGDPAPVKLPVSSMHNNSGVTVGMVMRLSK